MTTAKNTREKWANLARILHLANQEPNRYTFPCDSLEAAKKLRLNLYSCIRRAKRVRTFDQALIDIADAHAITLEGTSVVIYKRSLDPFHHAVKEQIDEIETDQSLERLKTKLSVNDPGVKIDPESSEEVILTPANNPYYKRED